MSDADDDDDGGDGAILVCLDQPQTEVDFNSHGQLVIRQDRTSIDEQGEVVKDPQGFVFFNVEVVPALIAAMRRLLGDDAEEGTEPAATTTTSLKDPTAAERQRRYRERHNGGVTAHRNGSSVTAP